MGNEYGIYVGQNTGSLEFYKKFTSRGNENFEDYLSRVRRITSEVHAVWPCSGIIYLNKELLNFVRCKSVDISHLILCGILRKLTVGNLQLFRHSRRNLFSQIMVSDALYDNVGRIYVVLPSRLFYMLSAFFFTRKVFNWILKNIRQRILLTYKKHDHGFICVSSFVRKYCSAECYTFTFYEIL